VGCRFKNMAFPGACCRASEDAAFQGSDRIMGGSGSLRGRSLGGEAFGGVWLVRRWFPDIRRRLGTFFLDLGEQPCLNRDGCPLSFRIIKCETAGF
jgi:hypothetical protein